MGEELSLEELAEEIQQLKAQKIVVIPNERTVKKFWGSGQPSLTEFEEQLNALWTSRQSGEEEKKDLLLSNLGDSVREEILCHPPDKRHTAADILTIIREVYGEQKTLSDLLGAFYAIAQRPSESIREYSHRLNRAFISIGKKAGGEIHPLGDKVLRDHFTAKLCSEFLRRKLREEAHKHPASTFLEIRNEAIRWAEDSDETSSEGVMSAQAAASVSQTTKTLELILDKISKIEGRLTALEGGPNKNQGDRLRGRYTPDGRPICLKCNVAGHMRRNCPKGNDQPL